MIQRFADAYWCSACWHPEGWADCRLVGETVVVRVNGVERWRQPIGPLRWPHMVATADGDVTVVGSLEVGAADRAYLLRRDGWERTAHPVYAMRGMRLTTVDDHLILVVCDSARTWVWDDRTTGR